MTNLTWFRRPIGHATAGAVLCYPSQNQMLMRLLQKRTICQSAIVRRASRSGTPSSNAVSLSERREKPQRDRRREGKSASNCARNCIDMWTAEYSFRQMGSVVGRRAKRVVGRRSSVRRSVGRLSRLPICRAYQADFSRSAHRCSHRCVTFRERRPASDHPTAWCSVVTFGCTAPRSRAPRRDDGQARRGYS
jgi:hypothetical protein